MTHICDSKLTSIASDNCLSPGQRQAIIWNNAGILLIGPLGTNFSEILIEIQTFSLKKIHLKMSSAKCRPFCLGVNVLMESEAILYFLWFPTLLQMGWIFYHVDKIFVTYFNIINYTEMERLLNWEISWLANDELFIQVFISYIHLMIHDRYVNQLVDVKCLKYLSDRRTKAYNKWSGLMTFPAFVTYFNYWADKSFHWATWQWWFSSRRAINAELWCLLLCYPQQAVEKTIQLSVI